MSLATQNILPDDITSASIIDVLLPLSKETALVPALSYFVDGSWKKISRLEFRSKVSQFAQTLIDVGLRAGDRIAIFSEPSPEWIIGFYAILQAGGVAVPLDTKATITELSQNLLDCMPRLLLSSLTLKNPADQLKSRVGSIRDVITLKNSELLKYADPLPTTKFTLEQTAILIYTSGTTGKPKGVMISYRSMISQTSQTAKTMGVRVGETFLSIIPMNHLFELMGALLSPLRAGCTVALCTSLYPQDVLRAIRKNKVARMTVVPLFLKMVKSSAEREIQKSQWIRRFLFSILHFFAERFANASTKRYFFPILTSRFGFRFRGFVSGGAPLDSDVAEFFESVGIPVYQGYGMTESGPVISTNCISANRMGSVGRPLPNTEIRIVKQRPHDDTGEIWVRGPQLMTGYWKQPELTEDVLDSDGWLHTGDLGRLDEDGFLFITGRIKNLIVLSGGKKVQPEEVEGVLLRSPFIKEVCVLTTDSSHQLLSGALTICAVVVPNENWAASKTKESVEKLANLLQEEVAKLCEELAPFKRPEKIVVRLDELPKSTTRKVKRLEVTEWLRHQQN